MSSLNVTLLTAALVCLVATPAFSATARSNHYTMEYSATGMGGGISSSSTYELVAYTDDNGSASKASSTSYTIEPAVGAADSTPRASVASWSLYE